jgi:ABC-type Na+ transport system ATPase subunit NatA
MSNDGKFPIIEVRDLGKTYESEGVKTKALSRATFSVEKGGISFHYGTERIGEVHLDANPWAP